MGTAGDGSMDTSECFGPSGSGGGVHTAIASSSFGDAVGSWDTANVPSQGCTDSVFTGSSCCKIFGVIFSCNSEATDYIV